MRWNAESRYVGLYNTYDTFLSFICFELNLLGERITVQGSDSIEITGMIRDYYFEYLSATQHTILLFASSHFRNIRARYPTHGRL